MVATVSPTVDSDQLITTTVAHKNMQILRKPKQNKNKNLTCLKKQWQKTPNFFALPAEFEQTTARWNTSNQKQNWKVLLKVERFIAYVKQHNLSTQSTDLSTTFIKKVHL